MIAFFSQLPSWLLTGAKVVGSAFVGNIEWTRDWWLGENSLYGRYIEPRGQAAYKQWERGATSNVKARYESEFLKYGIIGLLIYQFVIKK